MIKGHSFLGIIFNHSDIILDKWPSYFVHALRIGDSSPLEKHVFLFVVPDMRFSLDSSWLPLVPTPFHPTAFKSLSPLPAPCSLKILVLAKYTKFFLKIIFHMIISLSPYHSLVCHCRLNRITSRANASASSSHLLLDTSSHTMPHGSNLLVSHIPLLDCIELFKFFRQHLNPFHVYKPYFILFILLVG